MRKFEPPLILSQYKDSASLEPLKEKFFRDLAAEESATATLRDDAIALLGTGVKRCDIVLWAVERGYSESHIRNLLSRLLRGLGVRGRRLGAGRRVLPEAMAYSAQCLEKYGYPGLKFLLTAYRAGKAHQARDRERAA